MNCEEFEILGLDAQRDNSIGDDSRERALQHLSIVADPHLLRYPCRMLTDQSVTTASERRSRSASATC